MDYKPLAKCIIYFPLTVPHLILFILLGKGRKQVVKQDIEAWSRVRQYNPKKTILTLIQLLVKEQTFRNQFYMRVGIVGYLLNIFLRQAESVILSKNIGPGFVLMHSYSTRINPFAVIGKNCMVMHCVTIGWNKEGAPVIGDNVTIGAGAIIIGNIQIGNNVKIGAGAIVVTDVPDNSTVVCEKAKIITH